MTFTTLSIVRATALVYLAITAVAAAIAAPADSASLNRDSGLHERFVAGEYDVTTAEFVYSDADEPPVAANWQPVKLPHLWPREKSGVMTGWYRFALPDEPFEQTSAVYLWRFSMNAAVWLNDQFLGDGGRFTEPMARNWNRPFLFLLPESAFNAVNNYLYIKLAVYPGWGNLPPIVIGPYDKLKPDYDRRYQWQISFSQATWYISLITALVALTFWLIDRSSSIYGIFSLVCVAWSLYSLNNFIQHIPVDAKTWWWAVHSAVDWYGIMLVLFGHRLLNLRRPAIEAIALGWAIAATLFYAAIELPLISRYNSYVHLVTLLMVTYLFITIVWSTVRKPSIDSIALLFCMLVIVSFAIHDLSMNSMLTASLWQNQFFWLQFSAPILMLTMLVILSRRFVLALQTRLDAEQQIRIERERIFADVHDDVGSRVLSLVYAAENDSQASIARDALQEIRAIVSGATNTSGDLAESIDRWQAEAQERCEHADIHVQWHINIEDQTRLKETDFYHLQRIFRELVSNVIKHARTDRVEITIAATSEQLTIIVRDYGQHATPELKSGTGIASIRRRTNDLGGSADWHTDTSGCTVTVTIPGENL